MGPLAFLPLHAAGSSTDGAFARVVSSYTPTLSALLRARSRPPVATVRQLAVALPSIPDGRPLPAALRELGYATAGVPPNRTRRLVGSQATARAVRAELGAGRGWVHLACHAQQDQRHPADSAFLLWDWRTDPLTVGDLAALRLENAELAVLSACETSAGTSRLYDEAVHLAAAMQLIGFRHVVATLWTAPDAVAPNLARPLYAALVREGALDSSRSAWALDAAVAVLRDRYHHDPRTWAAYVHLGP